jgi:hypothetical protein
MARNNRLIPSNSLTPELLDTELLPGVDVDALPHSLEAERSVIGSILIDNEAYAVAASVVDYHAFFREAHRLIFRRIVDVMERGQPLDLVILKDDLENHRELDDVGGPAYLASLIDGVPRATNVAHYAGIVTEKAQLRAFIQRFSCRVQDAYAADISVDDILAAAAADLSTLTTGPFSRTKTDLFVTAADTIGSFVSKIKTARPRRSSIWCGVSGAAQVSVGSCHQPHEHACSSAASNHVRALLISFRMQGCNMMTAWSSRIYRAGEGGHGHRLRLR